MASAGTWHEPTTTMNCQRAPPTDEATPLIISPEPPNSLGKVFELRQPVPNRQHRLLIIDMHFGLEAEGWDRGGIHVDHTRAADGWS